MVLGLSEPALADSLRACSEHSLLAESDRARRAPEDALMRQIVGAWPEDFPPPQEIVWFHGTRLPRSTDFREGLLPFTASLPGLIETVERLAIEVGVPHELLHKGEMSGSHSMKLALADESGPYGSLLRDVVLRPTGAHRDFLDTPEIVYDLAHSVGSTGAAQIIELYRRRTSRCVVWFIGRDRRQDVLKHALMYTYRVIHADGDPNHWNTCFNGRGKTVSFDDILNVEWLDG